MFLSRRHLQTLFLMTKDIELRTTRLEHGQEMYYGPHKKSGEGPRDLVQLSDVIEQLLDHLNLEIIEQSPYRPACQLRRIEDNKK